MAQHINDNLRLHAPKLLDDRAGPYASVAAALAGIPAYQRVEGLEVIIEVGGVQKKYWFDGGVADGDLVEIPGGGSGGYEPKNSIEVDADELQLVGDQSAPGNNKVYGTDALGAKGWKDDPAGGSAAPEYNPINTVVYYDDGKVKQVKTDIGGGLFIDKRVEYAESGDEIGKASLAEIKDESVSPALWKSITYNYTDGVLTSTTVADIVAWTITI
jgi:hypothetical protein